VEENTIEDAYSVDDESSGDDFVVVTNGKGKCAKQSKLVEKRGSGSSLLDTYAEKGTKAKELDSGCKGKKEIRYDCRFKKTCLARISFADMLDFKVDGIPSKIGFYVVDNSNQDMMEIKLKERSIVITKQSIGEMLRLRNEGVYIMVVENAKDVEMVKDWVDQFKKGKDITPSAVKFLIRKSKLADMNFKLNFIVLFTSLMGGMMYVDGTVCNEFNVGRKRPPTSFWTTELLKEREYEEIITGGFGNSELQGTFVEEEGDPMPEDAEGFLWKLNKYVENIRKERNGFERTFEAANEVFCDNTFIADVYQQYRAALHYKHRVSQGQNCSNLSGDNNDESHKVSALQEYVDKNSKDYDSHVLGVTRDFEMVLSLEAPITDRNTPTLGSAPQIEPVKAVPVNMCKPVLKGEDLVNARGKRKGEESGNMAAIGSDQSAILFETKTGTKASRQQMESLVNGESIHNGVVDAWSEFLNSLEIFRSENSMSRFFLPAFVVDKKLFGREDKAIENVTNFMMDVEKVNERAGRKNMLKLVDLVFIPVSNNGHKFLICFNLKYPAVNLICSKNNLTKDGYRKSMVVTDTNDMVVATVMQKGFGKYLVRLNHNKVAVVLSVEVNREDFYWQTDKRPNDSGVFFMHHIEAYMGNVISKWACGLEAEDKKQ
ncbi:C2 calcium-dependent membrane-targeting protein, partial [Tanacetum coccineum]